MVEGLLARVLSGVLSRALEPLLPPGAVVAPEQVEVDLAARRARLRDLHLAPHALALRYNLPLRAISVKVSSQTLCRGSCVLSACLSRRLTFESGVGSECARASVQPVRGAV